MRRVLVLGLVLAALQGCFGIGLGIGVGGGSSSGIGIGVGVSKEINGEDAERDEKDNAGTQVPAEPEDDRPPELD